ncbi:hypothetical protein SRO_0800 [Streptomyces rochei]|nr:hypothetical protein SRO_0800 [Streptomyces rochei]
MQVNDLRDCSWSAKGQHWSRGVGRPWWDPLVPGTGSFFEECEHPRSRWSKCPHPYKIRYRSAAGKQVEESGFADRDKAIVASVRHLDSLLEHHLYPTLASRRMNFFDDKVVIRARSFSMHIDSVSSPTTRWPASSRHSTTPSAPLFRLPNNFVLYAPQVITRSC